MELIVPSDPNAAIVDAANVLLPTGKHPQLSHPRQVRGVKAADGSGSDDADAFHS